MFVTYRGHSCLLLQVADRRILLDPGGFSDFDDIRDLTAIVVTHQHADHLDVERLPALLRANPQARLIAEPQIADQIRERGFDVELLQGEPLHLGEGLTAHPIPGIHALIHEDLPRVGNTGVVFRAEGEPSLYHPGDDLAADPGPVDVLAVPLNGPWCALRDTVDFVRRIAAPCFVPIHDALLAPAGRDLYLGQVDALSGDGVHARDLVGRGQVEFTR